MAKLSIRNLDLKGKRTFIRVDFNVPLEEGRVGDDSRIRAALPTIQYAMDKGARSILASHLGRPKGKVNPKYTLKPVAERLAELIQKEVLLAPDCIGDETTRQVAAMHDGDVMLLENLRFHPEEENNAPEFAGHLARLCDVFVNDAFGTAHRAHASTEGITHFVKPAASGFLMERELRYLEEALSSPRRPYAVILGGAKVSDKIKVIENLLVAADAVLIGGAMAYTFLLGRGFEVGRSLVEPDLVDLARGLEARAAERGVKLMLPSDHVVAAGPDDAAGARNISVEATGKDEMGLDIGRATRGQYAAMIATANTIFWNGPMGMFEKPPFDAGTIEIARSVSEATERRDATSIVGGGDSVAAVIRSGLAEKITHISTGGGATLEFLSGQTLPGVAALNDY